jgi:hypothetical protein
MGESICFGEDTGSAGDTAIAGTQIGDNGNSSALYVGTTWGECACPAGLDECGVCAGSGIPVSDCDCYGNVEDDCHLLLLSVLSM